MSLETEIAGLTSKATALLDYFTTFKNAAAKAIADAVAAAPAISRTFYINPLTGDDNALGNADKQYDCTAKVAESKLLVMPRQGGQSTTGKELSVITINKTDVSRYQFRLGDRNSQKAVKTQHQDPKTGKLQVVELANDESPDGLPPVHTDRHVYPNKTAAQQAAKARLAAFNRSTAGVRLEMPGRTDLFAERSINAQGFKPGLDGEYLVDGVEQVFTQSGWSTTVECNGGKKGKAKASGKKKKDTKPLAVEQL